MFAPKEPNLDDERGRRHARDPQARTPDGPEDPRRKHHAADLRRVQRNLDGYTRRHLKPDGTPYYIDEYLPATGEYRQQLLAQKEHIENQFAYDRQQLGAAADNGECAIVTCVEIDNSLVEALASGVPGATMIYRHDFLETDTVQFGTFDRVVMNPPFSGGTTSPTRCGSSTPAAGSSPSWAPG